MEERRIRLLVVEPEPLLRNVIGGFLGSTHTVLGARERAEMLARLHRETIDLVVLPIRTPRDQAAIDEAIRAAADVFKFSPGTLVLMVGADLGPERLMEAARAGVHEFVGPTSDTRHLELVVRRVIEHRRLQVQVRRLQDELARRSDIRSIKGSSPATTQLRVTIQRVADSNASILVRGETGTGKGLVCRTIHAHSSRRERPLVVLNCDAFPSRLLEAELFGDAPMGSRRPGSRPRGAIVRADGGTLRINEPQSLPAATQDRLLRAVRPGEAAKPPGTARADVRLITSTMRDPRREMKDGRLVPALLRALSDVTIELLPLRERREDIPPLVEHFLEQASRTHGVNRKKITRGAIECLSAHPWRGNVRELESTVESLVLVTREGTIEARHLPKALRDRRPSSALSAMSIPDGGVVLSEQVAEFERALLLHAIEKAGGRRKEAAAILGINKDQLKYLCRKHNI